MLHPRRWQAVSLIVSLSLNMLLLSASDARAQAAQVATLAAEGQAKAKIYVTGPVETNPLTRSDRRSMTQEEQIERFRYQARALGVADLQHHLKQMTGADFEVVQTADPEDVTPPAIVFGELAVKLGAEAKHSTHDGEAMRLVVREPGLVLFGGQTDVAASHAMYHWLRSLGCLWIMPGPDGEVIPEHRTLTATAMDVAQAPAFKLRAPWYSGGPVIIQGDEYQQFEQWKRRMGQTHGRLTLHPDFMHGGHFWHSLIRHNKELLEENPEMRALARQPDGTFERGWSQLEATHPGVIDLVVEYIEDLFERKGWPKDKAVSLGIGPNDGAGYSQSAEAIAAGGRRVDPITGYPDQTDVLVKYTNDVLERVEDEYPNLKLGFLIYSVHGDYPRRYRPHEKFIAHFADITYSRYQSTLDRSSYSRNYYRGVVDQWARLNEEQGNPLWYYGYNWNLAENLFPYTKVRIWGEDLPYYHRSGVIGHNNEQDKAWSILGPHNHVMARLGWDIDADWKDLLREYTDAAFGKASDPMYRYYLLLDRTQTESGVESGSFPSVPKVLTRDFVRDAKKLLKRAAKKASTPVHKRNVDWFGQSVFMLEHFHNMLDAMHKADYVAAHKHYQTMMEHWQHYLDANSNLVSRYGKRYVDRWYYKPFLEMARQYTTGDYKLVHQLPDELPTMFDPENAGQLMGMYEPEMLDQTLRTTRTYRTTWDAQGLGPYRDGGVWYYDRFRVGEQEEDQGVGLAVGGVEDTVHVWVNGEYVGAGYGYSAAFAFDLTDEIRFGEDNTLALQVIRRNPINEAGLGGIIKPCFVFTGPQLEQKAPAHEPIRRVLPGGARGQVAK